ncbi:MAG TPA: A/G-specific adenine glycosylase [Bryobacteraceae bacterium]
MQLNAIRARLSRWYERNRRDLPWRRTRDPYAIWISEIMLQQTRVAAAIPYYERFLARFPDVQTLARASEAEALSLWGGLGYYSRARNLHKAAREVAAQGGFPRDYQSLRALPGVGDYTAAAVASIAFQLPYAAVDANVRRVIARLTSDAEPDERTLATRLLDRRDPGPWNQAMMELGALVCLPRKPRCDACPLAGHCQARARGTQTEVPPRRSKPAAIRLKRTLLIVRRRETILVTPSSLVAGFWDLPEPFAGARKGQRIGSFRHSILHRQYLFEVREGFVERIPRDMRWRAANEPNGIPLSTIAKKALRVWRNKVEERQGSPTGARRN